MTKQQKYETVQSFTESSKAFGTARRQAVYGHRDWIVWCKVTDGSWHAARRSEKEFERAMLESEKGGKLKVYGAVATSGEFHTYGRAVANIILKNLKGGYLS